MKPPEPPNEGFVDIDGESFYAIPGVDRMEPFLMSVVGDADHWMFVSSCGALTAGRRDATRALFPYETDDRLHRACGVTGPVTALRVDEETLWEPFRDSAQAGARRNLYKSVVGNQVVFEEVRGDLGLAFRYRWSNSDRFGFVRTASITNIGDRPASIDLVDGLADVLPFGLAPSLYQRMSNLTHAYKRNEVIDPALGLAVFSLEARIVDRAEPSEALRATVAWSTGLEETAVGVDLAALDAIRDGRRASPATMSTGRPGAYLLAGSLTIPPGGTRTWLVVADVAQDQSRVAALRDFLRACPDPAGEVAASVRAGTDALVAMMARSDALQRTGDRVATAHHYANVTYNVMRGGIFLSGYHHAATDFATFLAVRNRAVAGRHQAFVDGLPEVIERGDLHRRAGDTGDPQLMRLAHEYLPVAFSRRHGDPSRPWNSFSIRTRDEGGQPVISYEGNWRDIFQNWEALCLSFPEYLPDLVAVFVNASTPDGFNAYRISRSGIDWEVPEPDDPWSNIGYWGDHQVVYLLRLITGARRFLPGAIESLLGEARFSYADVPYRIVSYDEMGRDPKSTIRFDEPAAARSAARVDEVGGDGRLVWGADRQVYLVTLLEKLLVPALSKLSAYVPGGGIWMNTQRPEWNDANNALVGHGVSMVTLYHLRRYLVELDSLVTDSGLTTVEMSTEVADWLGSITSILLGNADLVGEANDARRKDVMDELGRAFSEYRSRLYASGFSATATVAAAAIGDLCAAALAHLDDTIRSNRRPDGLFHSYNLIDFAADGRAAGLRHLPEMLEGQVAVIGSGLLDADEQAGVVEALFGGALFRADQNSFMLYPPRRLAPFLDKNVLPEPLVAANPLLRGLVAAGDRSIVLVDADGHCRFHPDFTNAGDLAAALDALALREEWRGTAQEQRAATLNAYEEVFRHREFTGRSGAMYRYEGIGSVYWHMVAKLLVAVQEAAIEAARRDAPPASTLRLVDLYWRVRAGLGFNKTAAEYGAFPTDPYSHTPADAGAQQPGMTGQVKEELLTRLLELGLTVDAGEILFDPLLLREKEFLAEPAAWQVYRTDGQPAGIELPAHSLGLTFCQVPIVVSLTDGEAAHEVTTADGDRRRFRGLRLDRRTSRAVFGRTGRVTGIEVLMPAGAVGR